MAFPSTSGTNPVTLANALGTAMSVASYVKAQSQSLRDRSASAAIGSSSILGYLTILADARLQLVAVSALAGIAAYAQAQLGDSNLNIATEFTNMLAAMDAVRDWVKTNFPSSGGYLQAVQFQADGRTVDRQFDTATLATFRAQLDSLIATIN